MRQFRQSRIMNVMQSQQPPTPAGSYTLNLTDEPSNDRSAAASGHMEQTPLLLDKWAAPELYQGFMHLGVVVAWTDLKRWFQ